MDELGYKSKWEILNAKDYGIPQNRERCFMVSILGDYYYEFPSKMPLKKRLKDMLEDSVNERYYLSETAVKGCLNTTFNCSRLDASIESKDGVMPTLCARDYKDPKLVIEDARLMQVAQLTDKKYNEMTGRVYSDEGLSPTIRTMQGGCLEPKVAEPIVWDGFNQRVRAESECVGTITQNVGADLKRNGQGIIEPVSTNSYDDKYKVGDGNLVVNRDVACSKTTREGSTRADASDYISNEFGANENIAGKDVVPYRIRKLTPKECWRLMGFADEDVDSAISAGMSNAQLYKQAGNSIVVNVLEAIFGEML